MFRLIFETLTSRGEVTPRELLFTSTEEETAVAMAQDYLARPDCRNVSLLDLRSARARKRVPTLARYGGDQWAHCWTARQVGTGLIRQRACKAVALAVPKKAKAKKAAGPVLVTAEAFDTPAPRRVSKRARAFGKAK